MTEEAVRWCMRFCSRRFLWQQRGFLATTSFKDTSSPRQQLAHIWASTQSRKLTSKSVASSVKFYSQDRNSSDELEESELLPSPPAKCDDPPLLRRTKSPMLEQLQLCGSPSDVLDLTCRIAPTFREVSKCLNHMWSTTKKLTEEQRHYELQLMFENPALDELLKRAMKSVGYMRNDDMTYTLLSMIKLGVPQQSRVVQTFLRTCQVGNHTLSSKGISLSFCLTSQIFSS